MRKYLILSVLLFSAFIIADDYVDDVYYSSSVAQDVRVKSQSKPKRKDGMKEIIFIDDTQRSDSTLTADSTSHAAKQKVVKAVVK